MSLFIFVITIMFSCAKDSDLLLDSVIKTNEVSLEDENRISEDNSENKLVTRTYSFSPTNDAYIQSSQGHDKSIVRLQEDYRTSYLMFDLSAVNGLITDVVLQFSVDSDEGDGNIAIHKGLTKNWSEENLTIDNAPGIDMQLGNMEKAYKVGTPEKVALNASEFKSEITTLVMTHSDGDDLAFASKEHPTNKGPQLIVTYQSTEESPIIEEQEENTPQTEPTQEQTTEENTPQQDNTPNNTTAATEGAYYVTVNGKASNDGLSEATAWNIEHAFSSAVAGDVVYVKAGNYGNKQLITDNTGYASKPIKYIGYTNIPGDLVSGQESTFQYGNVIAASKMPLLLGNSPNKEGQGTAIKVTEPYIQIENFQITKYKIGIDSSGDHCTFKNIIATELGDFNPSHSYPSATSNSLLNYKGVGIVSSGDYSKISNCFILNAGAEGIRLTDSHYQVHEGNKVYSDNNINPTDYYYLISNDSKNNEIKNIIIERVGDLEHQGHGLSLKVSAQNNKFYNCIIKNTTIECSFSNVYDNYFENCKVIGSADKGGAILIANGAHNNTFKNCVLENSQGITFSDWKDGFSSAYDAQDAGHHNNFINCTVKDGEVGINFHFWDKLEGSAHDNTFTNCNFLNLDALFRVDRPNNNNKMIGGKVENVNEYRKDLVYKNTYSLNFSFDSNTIFTNNGFDRP